MNHPLIIRFHIKKSPSHTPPALSVQRNTDDFRLKGMVRAVPWQQLRPRELQRAMFAWNSPSSWENHWKKNMVSHMLYGIFTYKTGCFLGQMLVNIPYMEHMGLGGNVECLNFKHL